MTRLAASPKTCSEGQQEPITRLLGPGAPEVELAWPNSPISSTAQVYWSGV